MHSIPSGSGEPSITLRGTNKIQYSCKLKSWSASGSGYIIFIHLLIYFLTTLYWCAPFIWQLNHNKLKGKRRGSVSDWKSRMGLLFKFPWKQYCDANFVVYSSVEIHGFIHGRSLSLISCCKDCVVLKLYLTGRDYCMHIFNSFTSTQHRKSVFHWRWQPVVLYSLEIRNLIRPCLQDTHITLVVSSNSQKQDLHVLGSREENLD